MQTLILLILTTIPAFLFITIFKLNLTYKTVTDKKAYLFLIAGALSVSLVILLYKGLPDFIFYNKITQYNEVTKLMNKWFFRVAFLEELSKVILFLISCKFIIGKDKLSRKSIMVYMGITSLGFACVENFMYSYHSETPYLLMFLRFFTSTIAHLTYGLISGYFLSLFIIERRKRLKSIKEYIYLKTPFLKKVILSLQGILTASVYHGVYNSYIDSTVNFASGLVLILIISVLTAHILYKKLY